MAVRDLTVAYGGDPVVFDVSFALQAGQLMGVVGPNGAGKSTMLQASLGILPRLSGQVSYFGADLRRARQRVAYVPQRRSVDWDFPTTVFDLVLMGTYGQVGWLRRPGRAHRERVHEALEMLEMSAFARRQISELSGGQQQRAFLARALVQQADLYLMDEPFAGVDAKTERAIMTIMHELRDRGAAMLIVHHDLATVRSYFDSVLLINRRCIASGSTATAFTPESISETYGGQMTVPEE